MTDLPYYDDCNETELYSRESFTGNWSGSTEELYKNDSEHLKDILETAYRISIGLDLRDKRFIGYRPIPKFSEWTFYDEDIGKVHELFYSTESLAEFLKSEEFPAFWYAINEQRELLRKIGFHFVGYDYVTLKREDLELVPIKFESSELKDMPFGYPVKWVLNNKSTVEVDLDNIVQYFGDIVVKGDSVKIVDDNEEDDYPF